MSDRITSDDATLAQLEEAQATVARLQERLASGTIKGGAQPQTRRRRGLGARVHLAPQIHVSCYPGSLYATLLMALARLCDLANQDRHFATFKRNPTAKAAKQLLAAIGAGRAELEMFVHADQQFQAHCAKRTQRLRSRAKMGDVHAKGILKNRAICDTRGRWVGNLNEAISILQGNRAPNLKGVRKNTQIIRKIGLIFTSTIRNGSSVLYLFPQKFFTLFRSARSLAGE